MNLALSHEQELLREAARGTLSRFKTLEAAREALDGDASALPDLWPVAVEAGWPGLLISEDRGGAGLGAFDAMLIAEECGRVLASVPFLGVIPATAILQAAGHESLEAVAAGESRPVYVPARPPSDLEDRWTVDEHTGSGRAAAPVIGDDGSVSGAVPFVVDASGADLLVVVGTDANGAPRAAVVEAGAAEVESVVRYDSTRPLGHTRFDGAAGTLLDVDAGVLETAWHLAQALVAAESLGAVEATLEMSVAYAKERFTFGRPIGSYQAIKHELTEVLRRADNTRSLEYYAGWAYQDGPDEFPLAASAARSAAGAALDFAARSCINVHGGIGATWEHDAPLYFRRAQLSRRLFGGTANATDRVAELLLSQGAATAV